MLSSLSRRVSWFIVVEILSRLNYWYSKYCDLFKLELPFEKTLNIYSMPFDTVLKFGERTREEEALSMKLAHSLGLPVPRVLFYADCPYSELGAIWMTRVPGQLLSQAWPNLLDSERSTIMDELHQCLLRLRECKNPRSPEISSITGTYIKTFRACDGIIPPCADKSDFLRYLLRGRDHTTRDRTDESRAKFDQDTKKFERLANMSHSIVFAHGDLMRHNILVKDGHLSGIIDWECAGWLPEYWDYTTMTYRGYLAPSSWNFYVYNHPGFKYNEELICDHALASCTDGSFPR
ncbi:hypothetical protein C0993_004177 [Termitomyces sp. T159_Od127]|nr:hypothetical protein C0993_004177 [Termitomyces sp. T159_Od127]